MPGDSRRDGGAPLRRRGTKFFQIEILSLAPASLRSHLFFMIHTLTAILTREDSGFVALCPEVDVASQGTTVEEAKANLKEAVELFFECASETEVRQRMASESFISSMEVQIA